MSATPPTSDRLSAKIDELRELVRRAQARDESTLPALRKLVSTDEGVRLFGGDLAARAERAFVQALAGTNLAVREAVLRKLELLRAELLGPAPTPVERLLVERVVACWLQVQDADVRYAQAQDSLSVRQAEYHQRRMDAATAATSRGGSASCSARLRSTPRRRLTSGRSPFRMTTGRRQMQ